MVETNKHFFYCDFTRATWFIFDRCSGYIDILPDDVDGVQETILLILPLASTIEMIQKIFTALLYIWEARNVYRFNGKKWTIQKFLHETNVDLSVVVLFSLASEE